MPDDREGDSQEASGYKAHLRESANRLRGVETSETDQKQTHQKIPSEARRLLLIAADVLREANLTHEADAVEGVLRQIERGAT